MYVVDIPWTVRRTSATIYPTTYSSRAIVSFAGLGASGVAPFSILRKRHSIVADEYLSTDYITSILSPTVSIGRHRPQSFVADHIQCKGSASVPAFAGTFAGTHAPGRARQHLDFFDSTLDRY